MQIVGSDLHPGQQRVVDLILQGHKYIVVNGSRQTGKSFLSQNVIMHWAFNYPGSVILVTAPTYGQLKRPFEEITDGLQGANIIESANKSEFTIKFKNGSKVLFKSTERPDSMRGLTADFAVLDEAAYMADDVWKKVIKPILLVKGKQVLFISTPRSKNWFYDIYMLGQSQDNPEYVSTKMTYEENPFIDQAEIEEARRTLPDHIFRSEYLAEFTEGGQSVFQNLEDCTFAGWPKPTGRVYAGLDIGRHQDYTVLTIIDEHGNVVDVYRDNQKDWAFMVNEIVIRLKKWNAKCLIEVNNQGDVIFEQIKKQYAHIEPFVTSGPSKQQIIEALIVDFNNRVLKLPNRQTFPHLLFELEVFEYQWSPSARSIKYSAPPGLHDDCVMSLAIANRARNQLKSSGQYYSAGTWLKN